MHLAFVDKILSGILREASVRITYLSVTLSKEAPEGDAAVSHVHDGLRDGVHDGGIDTEGRTQHPPRLGRRRSRRRPRGAGAAPGEGRPARRGHGQDAVADGDSVIIVIIVCLANVLNNVAAVAPAVRAVTELLPDGM